MKSQKQDLLTYLNKNFAGNYLLDELLSQHTWYRIGGPADVFVYPQHIEDLIDLLSHCRTLDIETCIIGEGANILVHDAGYRGVIIHLAKYINKIAVEGEIITADAGAFLRDLVLLCEKHSLGGMECLSGIPGTVGGALIMNAGTHRGEIGERVSEVSLLNEDCEPIVMDRSHISFKYRNVPELQGHVLLGCKMVLSHEEETILKERRIAQLKERAAKQPVEYPSCGSVFKRPPGYYVGKMVEDLGLKGFRYGDAMISEKHGGFIINLGNAEASHVLYLIEKIKDEVYKSFNVQLEPEVRFVGF
jgi:UDP-N-acetylmuramate dehydrogenase